ncbi:3'-5' exonuclease [Corynebacterium bovis]
MDVETTGLDPATDRIIECAVLVVDRGEVRRTHSALVNPGRPLPDVITDITGMVDADLADAPRVDAALPRILDLIGDLPLLGHNVAFDIAFLEAEAHRAGVDLASRGRPGRALRDRAVCTAAAARTTRRTPGRRRPPPDPRSHRGPAAARTQRGLRHRVGSWATAVRARGPLARPAPAARAPSRL